MRIKPFPGTSIVSADGDGRTTPTRIRPREIAVSGGGPGRERQTVEGAEAVKKKTIVLRVCLVFCPEKIADGLRIRLQNRPVRRRIIETGAWSA